MKGPTLYGTLFGACLVLGGIATIWLGTTVLRLDREQRAYQEAAALEENARLALWRMDSALGPFIAAESMRPSEQYSAFYRAAQVIDPVSNDLTKQQIELPSPLMTFNSPFIDLHFEAAEDGTITSPQVPDRERQQLATTNFLSPPALTQASETLDKLRARIQWPVLLSQVQRKGAESTMPSPASPTVSEPLDMLAQSNASELQARTSQALVQSNAAPTKVFRNSMAPESESDDGSRQEGPMIPLWHGEDLLLVRTVRTEDGVMIQGCLLNWPALQQWLLGLTADLLPGASLVAEGASTPVTGESPGRQLAALPVLLVPGPLPAGRATYTSSLQIYLLLAVGGIVLATIAVSALLWGALSLSERRGRFVSAVTHELRTPLTTFRLYTEMLATGRVRDEAKRQAYVETLHAEAGRLSHLVDNVLAYARLDRGRVDDRLVETDVSEMLLELLPRLQQRAEQGGMTLTLEGADTVAQVRADPASVEQILFNLVDNACKYAVSATDRRIHIELFAEARVAGIRVRDHGPGIPDRHARRVFRPFTKSVHEAARTAPGVGLGLGLSRRLARAQRGTLLLERGTGGGASFVLRLPMARG
ncbi:MAG: HAMP domain-containing histidine kinase [Candidatus Hydrogenedentes bacterium]|nr:HAMP domain-containing histidine kinase [Candidatus Hydrogenedentota bacterium]